MARRVESSITKEGRRDLKTPSDGEKRKMEMKIEMDTAEGT